MGEISDLQEEIQEISNKYGHSEDPKVILLFLLEELGEATRAFLKEQGHKKNNDRVAETFGQELGDVFYLLLRLAQATDVNLEKEVRNTFEKLKKQ